MPDQAAEAFRPSPQQEAQWLTHPEGPIGRTQAVARLEGPLEGEAVAAALGRAVERHEILRTTFTHRPGIRTPLQLVHHELAPAWEAVELGGVAVDEQQARVDELAQAELRAPMDLAAGPLVRGCLIARASDRHVLILTCSALCADASSMPALLAEVAAHSGMELQLPAEPLQYADFSEWQHEVVTGDDEDARAGAAFWAELDGLASPALP